MILGQILLKKRLNMAAILKFKMAAEDTFEKNRTNSGFVHKGELAKNIGSTSIGNFCTGLHNPMYYLLQL